MRVSKMLGSHVPQERLRCIFAKMSQVSLVTGGMILLKNIPSVSVLMEWSEDNNPFGIKNDKLI